MTEGLDNYNNRTTRMAGGSLYKQTPLKNAMRTGVMAGIEWGIQPSFKKTAPFSPAR